MNLTIAGLKNIFKQNLHLNIALMLSVATLPWSLKINTGCIAVLILFTLLEKITSKKNQLFDYEQLFIGTSLYLISVLWLINTSNFSEGLSYLERTSTGLLFPLVYFVLKSTGFNLDHKLIFYGFIISCFVRYLYFLYQVLEWELMHIFDYWTEVLPQFNQFLKELDLHPTYFSIYLGFASILCVTESKKYRKPHLLLSISILLAIMNFTLAAKMPLFTFLIIYVYFFLREVIKDNSKKNQKVFFIGMLAAFLISTAYFARFSKFIVQDIKKYIELYDSNKHSNTGNGAIYGYDESSWTKTNRVYIWYATAEAINKNLFFGVGTGDINDELNKTYALLGFNYLADKNTNTHNQFLDFTLRFGLIGVFALAFFTLLLIRRLGKNKNVLFIGFLLFFFLSCLTENLLNRQLGIVFFHFFANLFLTFNIEQESKSYNISP